MTSQEYDKLSDKEKRIKVAELHKPHEKWEPVAHSISQIKWTRNGVLCLDSPADYLNDLNACHEFENTMDAEQQYQYGKYLLTDIGKSRGVTSIRWEWNATAKQRSKAFVVTMTK